MSIPRSRKTFTPKTSPFDNNNNEGRVEPINKIPQFSYFKPTVPTTQNSNLSFNEYASAIQQGLHINNSFDQSLENEEGDGDTFKQYSLSAHTSSRDYPGTQFDHPNQPFMDYSTSMPNSEKNYSNNSQTTLQKNISLVDPINSYIKPNNLLSSFFTPPPIVQGDSIECDRPLLEELGIDFNDVYNRFKSVILFQNLDRNTLNETDMFGPLCILVLFGLNLMLSGRLTFSLLYAIEVFGSICIYIILNCLSQDVYIDLYTTAFILGYSTLPIALLPVLYNTLSRIWIGFGVASFLICLFWSTAIASMFFETFFYMKNKRFMIAYPTLLFFTYFSFVAIL